MNKNTMKVAGALVCGMAMAAQGAITGVTGQTTWLLTPPAACTPGALFGPNAYAWNEKQALVVSNVLCDLTNNPGNSGAPVPGLISGLIDSHFIHFESNTAGNIVNGQVTFAGKIRGVIWKAGLLDITDVPLGAPATTYPTGNPFRGLNGSSFVSINNNVLTFHFSGPVPTSDLYQLRVLTEHVVPAPGALALLGLGGLVAARRRR